MTIVYIPDPDVQDEFRRLCRDAHNVVMTSHYLSNYFNIIHLKDYADTSHISIEPVRCAFGKKYKRIGPSILARLKIIPAEARYVWLSEL